MGNLNRIFFLILINCHLWKVVRVGLDSVVDENSDEYSDDNEDALKRFQKIYIFRFITYNVFISNIPQ
jgi:hypothetical protein